jgi:hypothetical protein
MTSSPGDRLAPNPITTGVSSAAVVVAVIVFVARRLRD